MSPLDALQSVYAKGERCKECQASYLVHDKERLSGRRAVTQTYRGCGLLDMIEVTSGADPAECPGVEDELNKEQSE